MTSNTTPAPAGKIVRTLIVSAFLILVMAGALFIPAMAGSDEECREVCPTICSGLGPWDGFWCQLFHPCQNTCHIPPMYDPGI